MKKTNQEAQPAVDGSFLRALQEHQQGAVLTELSSAMRKCVDATNRTGKPAKVVLEVTLASNLGKAVGFTAVVNTKLPKEKPFAGVFFHDAEGNLFRNDPDQQEIATLRVAQNPEQPVELRKAVNS